MKNSYLNRILAGVMATGMMATFPVTAFATNSLVVSDRNPTVGSAANSLENDDIIDTTLSARLTIHKYDLTAAQKAAESNSELQSFLNNAASNTGNGKSTGERNTVAESYLSDYALEGVVFSYMRVGSIATYSTALEGGANAVSGDVEVVYNIPASLMTVLSLFGSKTNAGSHTTCSDGTSTIARYVDSSSNCYFTSQQLNSALADLLSVNNGTDGKDALEKWARNQTEASSKLVAMGATDENGTSVADNLSTGLYLIIETSVPEEVNSTTNPFFVSLPMTDATGDKWVTKADENGNTFYDAHVYPKNQTNNPTIDKLVHEESTEGYDDTATVSEGDVLNYRIASKLPTITSSSTYLTEYKFVDQMSKGLSYNGDFEIKIYEDQDDAEQGTGTPLATWTLKDSSPKFSVTTDGSYSYAAGSKATISLTQAGLNEINKNVGAEKTQYSDKYLVVTYTVKAESAEQLTLGDSGSKNDVSLTYTRSNTNYSNTIYDEAIVYSYGINLQKNFSDADSKSASDLAAMYANVQFVLYNETDGYYVTAKKDAKSGLYYVTDGTKAATQAEATIFSPATGGGSSLTAGSLVINGLEADTYVLTEIHTNAGYTLLRDPITIEIKGTETTILPNVAGVTGLGSTQEVIPADVSITATARAYVDQDEYTDEASKTAATMSSYKTLSSRTQADGNADSGSVNAMVNMSVLNSTGFELPETGGAGVWVLTVFGVTGLAGGAYVLSKKGRKDLQK